LTTPTSQSLSLSPTCTCRSFDLSLSPQFSPENSRLHVPQHSWYGDDAHSTEKFAPKAQERRYAHGHTPGRTMAIQKGCQDRYVQCFFPRIHNYLEGDEMCLAMRLCDSPPSALVKIAAPPRQARLHRPITSPYRYSGRPIPHPTSASLNHHNAHTSYAINLVSSLLSRQ